MKFTHKNKQYLRSTGVDWTANQTAIPAAALKNANLIYKKVINGHWQDADNLKLRNDYPTIGEVTTFYEENVQDVNSKTVSGNVNALKQIVREVLGENVNEDEQKVSILTRDFGLKYQELKQKSSKDKDFLQKARSNISINAVMRRAKSIFSRKLMTRNFYKDFALPDVSGFMSIAPLEETAQGYKPIDPKNIEQMLIDVDAIKESNMQLYIINQLFVRMGLRNAEIVAARFNWIERTQNGAMLMVITRPDFKPKGSEGQVPIPSDLLLYLEKFKARDDDFLVPARSPTDRFNLVYRVHSQFVKKYIGDRQKTSYELRKHAGSIIATRDRNLMAAQQFLRHASPETTSKYYATLLKPVCAIEPKDLVKS